MWREETKMAVASGQPDAVAGSYANVEWIGFGLLTIGAAILDPPHGIEIAEE
jgi:hypothetical protein